MKTVFVQIIFIFLYIPTLKAQDVDQLLKYYEQVGKSVSSLTSVWGNPLKDEINDYGVRVYYFKKEKTNFEFSIYNQNIIGAIMKLQPGQDDGFSFTFYIVVGFKLEKEGFHKMETTYDAHNISLDASTHNFIKEYTIKDTYKKNNLIIRMSLNRNEINKLTLKSSAVLEQGD